ncbi:MAG: XdhC family protein [Halobacteriales archaeon]|nr:XdhC family protein [Halobacteriales archaeon]
MDEPDWGVPETDVLAHLGALLDAGEPAVLATVIGVEGSAYRRPGAKMVVEEDGGGSGHITAGCLEDEVFELADEVLAAGEPRVETYDLMTDGDDIWGLGVGCNGVIDILLEPIDDGLAPAVAAHDRGEPVAVLTALSGDVPLGARAFYTPDGGVAAGEGIPDWLADAAAEPAAALLEAGASETLTVSGAAGTAELFVDSLRPAPELAVFGSGHDVGPVVELAKRAGFRVTVVGYRGAADLEERFPRADATVTAAPGRVDDAVDLDGDTHAVVMTHNFIDDRLTVEALVDAGVPYIGLMGPRERFEEMLEEFEAEGRSFGPAALDAVYTPVGLDVGGGSPYQIATSIVAEVLAVANGRDPGHLREREAPIHDRVSVGAASED